MMERGGRKEGGKMNAFDLFAEIQAEAEDSVPVLGLVSLSADRDEAVAAGADFVVYGDRSRAQQQMLRCLRTRFFAAQKNRNRTMNEGEEKQPKHRSEGVFGFLKSDLLLKLDVLNSQNTRAMIAIGCDL
eukprot:symbB.v1.2.021547.t1/scaffold1866.1/size97981/5